MNLIPDLYRDRIPALIKHTLLEAYLEKLVMIIGMSQRQKGSAEICYVDCFAGPWQSDDPKLEGTSIALSLRTLADCKEKLATLGVEVRMRALFVEQDSKAFARLSVYLETEASKTVEASALQGDFVELRPDIMRWAGDRGFAFFFIDPKGWTPIVIDSLKPLLARRQSEFLINFIYEFINRTASIAEFRDDMRRLLGREVDIEGLSPGEREQALVGAYREGLKDCVPAGRPPFNARTAYVSVLHPEQQRTKYHLVYLSSHPTGIIEFMKISETVDIVQARVRMASQVDAKAKRAGMNDMFAEHAVAEADDQRVSPEVVEQFWKEYLALGDRRINEAGFADILEKTNWLAKDLQSALRRLIDQGSLENLDAIGKRRLKNPLHFKNPGERLRLLSTGA